MEIYIYIQHAIIWFCITSGIAMAFALLKGKISAHLITKDGSLRAFTMMDLELPSNNMDIPNLIHGIYSLPDPSQQNRVVSALKKVLYLDFLYMPALYGAVFLLCTVISNKFSEGSIGAFMFAILAWSQLLAWVLDVIENRMLLGYIRQDLGRTIPETQHRIFVWIVWIKWVLVLVGAVNAIMMSFYFWMKGAIAPASMLWIGVFVLQIVLFVVIGMRLLKQKSVG